MMESHGKSLVIKPLNVFIKASFSLPDVSRDDLSPNIINQDFRNDSQLSGHGSEVSSNFSHRLHFFNVTA